MVRCKIRINREVMLRIDVSPGLMNLDCSGVSTENSAICVCFMIVYTDSAVIVRLPGTLILVNYGRH